MTIRSFIAATACGLGLLLANVPASAGEAQPLSPDPAAEARMMNLAVELRCLVCQNQTIAESQAELAGDLRQQIRELIQRGQTDEQIKQYMVARYGDFVLYRPPVKEKTLLLWFGPGVILVVGLCALYLALKRRLARLSAGDTGEANTALTQAEEQRARQLLADEEGGL
jgi:cytochrome c-type biogenesis protein CcmH